MKSETGIKRKLMHENFRSSSSPRTEYQQLKLMQLTISKTNDLCKSLLDNLQLDALIPSPPIDADRPPLYSARAIKNTRRHMEDRHIIIDDFNTLFGIKVWICVYPSTQSVTKLTFLRSGDGSYQLLWHFRWTRRHRSGRIQCSPFALRNRRQPILSKWSP